MEPFTLTQWVIVLLVFLLGLVIGMLLFSGAKWKRRYREELRLREEVQRENQDLRRENGEYTSLRGAAAKAPIDRDRRGPL
jgi:uncharacterized membrane-anchored protein YhcB (DUF1043 family)